MKVIERIGIEEEKTRGRFRNGLRPGES